MQEIKSEASVSLFCTLKIRKIEPKHSIENNTTFVWAIIIPLLNLTLTLHNLKINQDCLCYLLSLDCCPLIIGCKSQSHSLRVQNKEEKTEMHILCQRWWATHVTGVFAATSTDDDFDWILVLIEWLNGRTWIEISLWTERRVEWDVYAAWKGTTLKSAMHH